MAVHLDTNAVSLWKDNDNGSRRFRAWCERFRQLHFQVDVRHCFGPVEACNTGTLALTLAKEEVMEQELVPGGQLSMDRCRADAIYALWEALHRGASKEKPSSSHAAQSLTVRPMDRKPKPGAQSSVHLTGSALLARGGALPCLAMKFDAGVECDMLFGPGGERPLHFLPAHAHDMYLHKTANPESRLFKKYRKWTCKHRCALLLTDDTMRRLHTSQMHPIDEIKCAYSVWGVPTTSRTSRTTYDI